MNKDNRRRTRKVRSYPGHTLEEALEIAKAIYRDNVGLPLDRGLLASHLGISHRSSSFTTLLAASEQYGFTKGRYKDDTISLTDLGISISMPKSEEELSKTLLLAAHTPEKFRKLNQLVKDGDLPKSEFLTNLLVRDLGIALEQTEEFIEIYTNNLAYIESARTDGIASKRQIELEVDETELNLGRDEPVSIQSVKRHQYSQAGGHGYLLFIDTTEGAKEVTSVVVEHLRALGIPTKSMGPYDDVEEPDKAVASILLLNSSEIHDDAQYTEIFAVGVANGITPGNVILISESIEFQKYLPVSALRQVQLITYRDISNLVMSLLTHLTSKGSLSMNVSVP
ncbi:hypothetical protein OAJ44_04070 [Chloroflexi bacterium]|nr:hypothetical protein [Chloroflexota bacterium]